MAKRHSPQFNNNLNEKYVIDSKKLLSIAHFLSFYYPAPDAWNEYYPSNT